MHINLCTMVGLEIYEARGKRLIIGPSPSTTKYTIMAYGPLTISYRSIFFLKFLDGLRAQSPLAPL